VTLSDAFEDIDTEIDGILEKISEAIDFLEKEKKDEAVEILIDVEESLLDFLGYEECECEEEEMAEEVKKETKKEKKPAKKGKGSKKG